MRNIKVKDKLYLIIPILFASFWIFLSLAKDNFYLFDAIDFDGFYYASRKIYLNPGAVYVIDIPGNQHYYLPCFATLLGLITVFCSYEVSMLIFFFILCIITILLIFEFDRLMKSSGVDKLFIRIIILLVISNSYSIFLNFDFMQSKLIPIFFLVLFLRREIQNRNNPEKYANSNNKFLFIQLMILIFALGMIPQYIIFFSIIYLFYGISWKEIFKKSQLKKYGLFILILCIQNFMLFIILILNPNTISFLIERGSSRSSILFYESITPSEMVAMKENLPEAFLFIVLFFINEVINLSFLNGVMLAIISLGILFVISLIIGLCRNMQIEIRFGYLALSVMCFSVLYRISEGIIFIPLVSLLFIITINNRFKKVISFIKSNFFWLLGLLSLLGLNLIPREYFYYKVFPFLYNFPVIVLLIPIFSFYLIFITSIYFFRINPKFKK